MLVVQTLPPPKSDTWYLAYGSNLSTSKFVHDRGIEPLDTVTVTVPGWSLVMDSAGFPYSEPAFANITPTPETGKENAVQLIGTAYKLTPEMYVKVLASEGGGIAYAEIEVRAQLIGADTMDGGRGNTSNFPTRSLVTLLRNKARPSTRYMGLLRTGASESDMPISYQKFLAEIPVYHPPTRLRPSVGAALFLSFWRPVMSLMERITKTSLRKSKTGIAPVWVLLTVRSTVVIMWLHHDLVHAPVWGRGDGLDE